jgi:hypothetical protein
MTSSLGLEPWAVRLVRYDPDWPMLFDAEARRIAAAWQVMGQPFSRVFPSEVTNSQELRPRVPTK